MQTYATTGDATLISKDGTASVAVLVFDVPLEEAQKQVPRIRSLLQPAGLNAYVTGEPAVYADLENLSSEDLRRAESYALPFALIVLLLVFGSVVAAALPVIGGGMAVTITLGVVYFLAQRFDMSIFVMNTASMLGLAVGIDYSLFIVGRFREELAGGATVAKAVETTVARAGRSIFFSGIAVVIGLFGLVTFQYMSLRSIGWGGAIVVFFSVASALTLLPALLGILGPRVDSLRILGRRRTRGPLLAALVGRRHAPPVACDGGDRGGDPDLRRARSCTSWSTCRRRPRCPRARSRARATTSCSRASIGARCSRSP